MKRLAWIVPAVIAFVVGIGYGSRMQRAEAQRAPRPVVAASCSETLAQVKKQLRASRKSERVAVEIAKQADQARDQADAERAEMKALYEKERERRERLEKQIGSTIMEGPGF